MADKKTIGAIGGAAAAGLLAIKLVTGGPDPSLPDPTLTPGEYANEVKWQRSTALTAPQKLKYAVFQHCHIPWQQRSNYVIVYLVPPEVGGIFSTPNLYPIRKEYAKAKYDADAELIDRCMADMKTNRGALLDTHRKEFAKNWVANHKAHASK